MDMARAALGYLAAADATQLAAETQAECLRGLERTDAIATAARASFLSAFTVAKGYSADADYSARSWLMHRTGITRGAAASHTAWAKRADTHPRVLAALATEELSESYGRTICQWTDKLPEKFREESDELLVKAAAAGLGLRDLAALFAEMYERARSELPDEDPDRAFGERGGQPVKVWAHISLADLLQLDGSSALQEEWTAQIRAQWAAHRAAAAENGANDGAWLDGDAAEGIACDAAMAPIVTGDVNVDALEDLVRLCVELDRLRQGGQGRPDTTAAWAAIERAVIGKAVDLLSGPGGLASFLRRRQLGARLAGPSLPLDIGYAESIPAGIRNAVLLRDPDCQWAGGCTQPAGACEVHHTTHKAHGGTTSVKDCVLLCPFHHQIVIHRWGWTLVVNPDGTTSACNKNKTKTLHSHGPPARPG